jgi:hypothetical protein
MTGHDSTVTEGMNPTVMMKIVSSDLRLVTSWRRGLCRESEAKIYIKPKLHAQMNSSLGSEEQEKAQNTE